MKRFSILLSVCLLIAGLFGGCDGQIPGFQKWVSVVIDSDVSGYVYVEPMLGRHVYANGDYLPLGREVLVQRTPIRLWIEITAKDRQMHQVVIPERGLKVRWGENAFKFVESFSIPLDGDIYQHIVYAPDEVKFANQRSRHNIDSFQGSTGNSSDLEERRIRAEEKAADAAEDSANTQKWDSIMNTLDLYKKHGIIK
jgi:hypothetical protein